MAMRSAPKPKAGLTRATGAKTAGSRRGGRSKGKGEAGASHKTGALPFLMQPKLTINKPNDQFEREADDVADRVMRMPEGGRCRACKGADDTSGHVQRQEEEEEAQTFSLQRQEEEEEAQTFSLQRQEEEEEAQTFSLQRQEEEEEAQTFSLQRQEEEEEAQTFSLQRQEEEEEAQTFSLQRQEEEEEAQTFSLQRQEEEEEAGVQAKRARTGAPRVTPRFEARLRTLKSNGGRSLDGPVRQFMETRFGRSFETVRVHTGPDAAQLAKQANARAFTVGKHLVFGQGEYKPNADQGRRLIAHELTHVLQQRGGLHSVQRELFQPEPAQDAVSDERALSEIRRLMGMEDGRLPGAIQRITSELLRTALASPDGDALRGLTDTNGAGAVTARRIETADYILSLSLARAAQSARAEWMLTRAGEDRPLFAGTNTTATEAASPPSGADEQTVRVPTPLPPTYAAEGAASPAPESASGTMSSEQTVPESDAGPAPRQTPEPSPPESDALKAADKPVEAEVPAETNKGRGDATGSDDPALARPAVDVQAEDDIKEEESAPDAEVQRKASGSSRPDPGAEQRIAGVLAQSGAPLPRTVRRDMEPRLGADLSAVRIHQDGKAGEAARSIRAKAFTVGEHVVFGPGQFQPETETGRTLLAHELTHVLQQRDGRSPEDLLQRQGDEDCPEPEPVPEVEIVNSPSGPKDDPAFAGLEQRTENRAANQQIHGEGDDKSQAANAAADVKEGENKSHAQTEQVGTMASNAENPPAFDKQAFVKSVLAEVEKIAPKTLDDVDKFADRGKAAQIKGAVQGQVTDSAGETQGPLEESATADPGPGQSPRTPAPLSVEPPGPQPGSIRADRSMPPPRTESEVDFSADNVRADNMLKEACITRSYIEEHGDPELQGAAEAQDQVHAVSEEAPQKFRAEEATELAGARAGASAEGARGLGEMFGSRSASFSDVGTAQQKTKTDNEVKRDAAAAEVNTIFSDTQTKVQDRLKQLDKDVNTTFDTETKAATDKFERFIRANAEKYKKSWFDSAVDWFADILFDPPPQEVRDFYKEGRVTFLNDMEVVIGNIADLVDKGLQDARKLVEDGKAKVKEKLDKLGGDLEDFKQQIADEMNDKFRGLEGDINKKQGEIVKGLAKRYVKAFENVKKLENQVREEYKNAFDRLKEAVGAAADFLTGWIDKLAGLVGGAASRIIRKPGQFLKNLGAGIIQGFTMFMGNIGENIQSAVVTWLTGNLGSAGIQLPATFDTKGIIGFLLDLVGLGVSSIKNIARQVFGRRVVSLIEKGAEGFEQIKRIFDILSSEGPAGLLQFLQSEFERMKGEVLAGIGKAIAEGLVIAGIKKILGIVSGLVSGGVGTVITIVATIIDVVLWVRDNAAQIAELVSTITGMAMAILNGQVGAVANAINEVLKRLLPMVLGFVGALIGIGGTIRKIQNIFKKIRKPATKAVTSLFKRLKKAVSGLIKKLTKKGGKGKGKGKGKDKNKKLKPAVVRQKIISALSKPSKESDPTKALAETRQMADRLKSQYQPKLSKSTIRITILDQTPAGIDKDGDIDIDVALSPGTRTARPVSIQLVRPMPRKTIEFLPHTSKSTMWRTEYARQLTDQQAAINAMKANVWQSNRRKFMKGGRDSASAGEQEKFRREFEAKMLAKELAKEIQLRLDRGESQAKAEKNGKAAANRTVAKFMRENVALHDPDQIAGGSPDAIKRMGLKRVNSSIGSQWRTRVPQLDSHVAKFLRKKGNKKGDPNTNMKVNLSH